MKIYKCGTEVILKKAPFTGFITAILIQDARISYRVSYFKDGTRIEDYFSEYEFVCTIEKEENLEDYML